MKLKISHRQAALIAGSVAFVGTGASLASALMHGGPGQFPPAVVAAISIPTGFLIALFFFKRLYAWFFFLAFGTLIGVVSDLEFVFGPPVETEFDVAFLTMAVFVTLGFLLGGIAELIWQIHRALHGTSPRTPREAGAGAPRH